MTNQLRFKFAKHPRFHRLLSYLLWQANCRAGYWTDDVKSSFYFMKSEILQRFGTTYAAWFDVQQIDHSCWSCHGTGQFNRRPFPEPCYKCNGTGVYRRIYIKLQRYQFADRTFYIPGRRLEPDGARTYKGEIIKGYIQHPHIDDRTALQAAMLLSILCRVAGGRFRFIRRYVYDYWHPNISLRPANLRWPLLYAVMLAWYLVRLRYVPRNAARWIRSRFQKDEELPF
ncbi:MAG TPA: hypothetical protein DCM28_05245 [Phycisphaerales bacterium]|nr:hypothetical protein [Phycisphaerales bacterium]HCD31115.1 hypothetical protein [Phycisphaerales bacterium]|tara:strand:- start:551 stop:1234 length:684 start_codon:yes stop_codon:yes gene_type:complete